ncbi:hypothetical protein PEBR_11067 [Penicillium brasilianum]|uniref:Glycosyl transferase n=1 Tax=Penicillium brasilianum TaxID=104259 RepID=A0A1S9RT52_PENBI|nr:hypothetical protein PEBR_11067 [Penicillium brasilianum]
MPRMRSFASVAILGFLVVAVLYLLFTVLCDIRQHFDFSGENRVESFNFRPTKFEESCFTGNINPANTIPRVVHVIWLDNTELNFRSYLTIRSALISLQPDRIKLHVTDLNEQNEWFMKLRENVTLVQHDLETEYGQQIKAKWQIPHIADLLRLNIIAKEGGIYLDMDVIALRSFDNLLGCEKDLILGNEGGDRHGLCNAIIIGRPGSSFIKRWRESYSTFTTNEWNYHSVILPKELSSLHHDICTVSPSVFYWPTWTKKHIRYMHEPITQSEARNFEATIIENGGGMYPDQLAYHAWSQVASTYLKDLSPAKVDSENTRYNVLVRRFME